MDSYLRWAGRVSRVFAILSGLLMPWFGHASDLYLYNPETNIDNFASLKKKFEDYFSGKSALGFVPFSKGGEFDEALKGLSSSGSPAVLLISSWQFRDLPATLSPQPLLVGEIKGGFTQRKILTARNGVKAGDSWSGKRLASSASEPYTRRMLKDMMPDKDEQAVKVIVVPKDIDALMSVAFGMADLALTTEMSMEKLKRVNPTQFNMLTTLASSGQVLLPVVVSVNNMMENKQSASVSRLLSAMSDSDDGRIILQMIGLDGFRKPGAGVFAQMNGALP